MRFTAGKDDGWDAKAPGDELLRPAPATRLDSWPTGARRDRERATIYAYDRPNARIVAIDKADGDYKAQYRLAGGRPGWDGPARRCTSCPGATDGPPTARVDLGGRASTRRSSWPSRTSTRRPERRARRRAPREPDRQPRDEATAKPTKKP